MAATATAPPVVSPLSGADGVEQEDSNISSPLSEVDDKDGNDDDINMHLNGEDENDSSMTADGQADTNQDGLDSDSDLSDARSVAHTDANDTEAETERLYDTPQHQRQRDVVVDQYNDGQIFEHTPSKLRRTAAAHGADDESILEDAASEASDGSVAPESPSKIATTKDTSVDDEHQHDSHDRKRKRSLATDNSESEQPLRKRTGSVGPAEVETDQELAANEETPAVAKELDGNHPAVDDGEASPANQYASTEEIPIERETRATKKLTRNGSKRKGSGDDVEGTPAEAQEEGHENEIVDEQEQQRETIEVEAEEEAEAEADAAAKSAEEGEFFTLGTGRHQTNRARSREETSSVQRLVSDRGNVWRIQRQVRGYFMTSVAVDASNRTTDSTKIASSAWKRKNNRSWPTNPPTANIST